MRLYEIVVLVLALCLVKYTKAESETDAETLRGEETLARDANLDSIAYLKEDPEKVAEEDPKIPTKRDAEEDFGEHRVTRGFRDIRFTISFPTNNILKIFHIKYCFRRSCYVPGLRHGFLSYRVLYQSGYVGIKNYLYYFWNCTPKKWRTMVGGFCRDISPKRFYIYVS
ncbi:unnamed protein product [Porites lobata]|uniref:Uncharacterized protein n=1 Tax=Porites lobata TaxID=104759 RepID=A0ABN8SIZ3_9CNID|nr:unnamed protein product [Porites lobata]